MLVIFSAKTLSSAHSYDVIDGEKSGMFGAQSAIELQPGKVHTANMSMIMAKLGSYSTT